MSENIGELIRSRRKELGWKVYELASKVNVDPVYITQIEKHNKLPSPIVFKKIEEVLNLKNTVYPLFLKNKYPTIFNRSNPIRIEPSKMAELRRLQELLGQSQSMQKLEQLKKNYEDALKEFNNELDIEYKKANEEFQRRTGGPTTVIKLTKKEINQIKRIKKKYSQGEGHITSGSSH